MKSCPQCNRTYSDESLSYCLVDGAVLSAPYDPNQTLRLPDKRTTDQPTDRPPALSTITAVHSPVPAQKPSPREERSGSKPWLLIGLGLTTLSLVVVAAVLGFLLFRERADVSQHNSNDQERPTPQVTVTPIPESTPDSTLGVTSSPTPKATPTPTPRATATPTPRATPPPTESPTIARPTWATRNNTSINEGTRITYYPTTTPERCRSDCQANPNCRAATYIRQGAYNPGDPPMCYLMAAIKTLNPSTCCISFIRQ
jgi:hypothetical protein